MISSFLNKIFSFSSNNNKFSIQLKDINNDDQKFIRICQVLDQCGAIPVNKPETDWSKSIIDGSLHYQIDSSTKIDEMNQVLKSII